MSGRCDSCGDVGVMWCIWCSAPAPEALGAPTGELVGQVLLEVIGRHVSADEAARIATELRRRLSPAARADQPVTIGGHQFKWIWLEEWQLIDQENGGNAATVWDNGDAATWHTWDTSGVGGENATDPTVEQAKRAAEEALLRQGWHERDVEPDEDALDAARDEGRREGEAAAWAAAEKSIRDVLPTWHGAPEVKREAAALDYAAELVAAAARARPTPAPDRAAKVNAVVAALRVLVNRYDYYFLDRGIGTASPDGVAWMDARRALAALEAA